MRQCLGIVLAIGLGSLLLLLLVLPMAQLFRARWAGRRGWPSFVRWVALNLTLCSGVSGWAVAGMETFLCLTDFWRGAWSGATAILLLGYVPTLIGAIRMGTRQAAEARAAHLGSMG